MQETDKKQNKNNFYKGFALALILLIALPLFASATPTQTQSFAGTQSNPYILGDGGVLFLDLNDFFGNYEIVDVAFFNPFGSGSIFLQENINDFTQSVYYQNNLEVGLYSFGDSVILQLANDGVTTEETLEISLFLISPTGQGISDSFFVTYETGAATPVTPPPSQSQSFVNYELGFDDFVYLNLNNFYNNYDEITLSFIDPDGSPSTQTLIQSKGGLNTQSYIGSNFDVYLDSFSNAITLDIISKTEERTINFEISASSSQGNTNTDTFSVIIEDDTPPPVTPQPSGELDISSLNNAVISYYKLDENTGTTATDSKGSNDGTISGAIWTTGKIGSGLSFDGSNDYVEINQPTETQGTFNVWVNANNLASTQRIFSLSETSSLNNFFQFTMITNGRFRISDTAARTVETQNTFNSQTWNMVTFMSTGTQYKIYVNGVEQTLSVDGSNTGNWFGDFSSIDHAWFGKWERSTSSGYFDGLMDEIAIFNRALTIDEIEFLYANGNPNVDQQYEFEGEDPVVPDPDPDPTGPPTDLGQIPNVALNYESFNGFLVNDYFSNFDEVELAFLEGGILVSLSQIIGTSETQGYTPQSTGGSSLTSFSNDDFGVVLHKTTNGVYVEFESFTNEVNKEMNIAVYNEEGGIQQSFDLIISESIDETGLPVRLQQCQDINKEIGEESSFDLNEYFINAQRFGVLITDKSTGESILQTQTQSFSALNYEDNIYDVNIQNNVLTFSFKKSGEFDFKVRALNNNGIRLSNNIVVTIDQETQSGIITSIFNNITGLFPSSENLSNSEKIGYTIITMFLLTLILGLGLSQSSVGLSPLGLMIIAITNFVLFIYFIAIGYIGLGLLITLSLIALGLSYFKLRSNTAGGV